MILFSCWLFKMSSEEQQEKIDKPEVNVPTGNSAQGLFFLFHYFLVGQTDSVFVHACPYFYVSSTFLSFSCHFPKFGILSMNDGTELLFSVQEFHTLFFPLHTAWC